jgi:hypothetical protein
MKKVLLVMLVFTLFSCADRVGYQIDPSQHIYGFWGGVWHGAIMFPDFIGSLIWDDVAVYATNNNGAWYDFGFVGGLWLFLKWIKMLFRLIRYSLNKE